MIFCFWWIWKKVELQCTWWNNFSTISKKYHTYEMEDIFCKLQVDKMFPSKEICPLQLLEISWNKLVIYHFWILKVTTAHRVFRLFLVLAMHWSSKCIGEAERDVPSYASTFGRSVIYAIMHSALCTPFSPATIPYFCNYAWQAWTFHQLPISAPHPPLPQNRAEQIASED